MNIRKGDKVMIMKGKDRSKSGKVIDMSSKNSTIVVEGLNLYKKSLRPKKQGEKGQIISVPKAIKMGNVMLVCSSCGKPSRTGIKVKTDKNGIIKERFCKKCNAIV